ncbi:MAG: hypothetical protein LBD31_04785 [Treponema sp.]|nr:hypothetical protein [Treponema sp.]
MDYSRDVSLVLQKEAELLEQLPPLQVQIREAVIKREWADYQKLMEAAGRVGSAVEALEAEREVLFAALTGEYPGPEPFYAHAAALPRREREELTARYRRVKMISLQVKLSNDLLMEYLREARAAVAGLLESAYPDRRGRLYSRRGVEREADMRSVMVNRIF